MSNPILFPAADFVAGQANQFINQQYADYNRREDQKLYERNAELAYGYSKKAAQDSSTAMLTGMKNAGISPATMTGGMAAFPVSSGHAPSTKAPQGDQISVSKGLFTGAQYENLQVQNENLQEQNELLKAQTDKTKAEAENLRRENTRRQDEDDKYIELSGQTFGAIKAITEHAKQRTSWQSSNLEYIEGQIKAEVLKSYASDKSNIENEVLHRINNNSKAIHEVAILTHTLENLKEDKTIKEETAKNLKKQAEKIEQEIKLTKEQADRLKNLNIKKMLDEGDYIGALLALVIQLSGQASFSIRK